MTVQPGGEVYAEISVVAGAITDEGISPAAGVVKRLVATPNQLLRLMDLLGSIDAFRALLLAIEHGELYTDPLRIEVPGWKREWLMAKGMTESRAKSAVSALKRAGFITKVYGERGAAGGGVAVVNGNRFAWPEAVTTVVSESGRPRLVRVSDVVDNGETLGSTRVGTFGHSAPERAIRPVDNSNGTFGLLESERESREGRLDVVRPGGRSPKRQVSAIGQEATNRDHTGSPSKEVVEEESLLVPSTGSGGPLTRTNLHRLFAESRLREALNDHEVRSVTALASVFARNPEATVSALAFFDREFGDSPDIDLAWFAYDLLTTSGTDVATVAQSLASLLRSKAARIPKMRNEEILHSTVVTLVAAMDKQPRSWPGFTVWAMANAHWESSSSVRGLVGALTHIVYGPPEDEAPAPEAMTADPSPVIEPAPSGVVGLPERVPQRTAGPMSPSEEEQHARGEGYWDWLHTEVIAGTEYDDPIAEGIVKKNRGMQDRLINAYRRANQSPEAN